MRLLMLLLVFGLLVVTGLIVHENAAETARMTVFGRVVFEGVPVPVLILVSLVAGMLLMMPFLAVARIRKRPTKKDSVEPSSDRNSPG